jgi:hypothetical protein
MRFYEPDVNEWEMFDLQNDPHEMQSIYGRPYVAKTQQYLLAELNRLRAELKVPESDPPASLGGGKDNPTSRTIRKQEPKK